MPSKPAKPPRPTAAELDLLRVIWRLGPATVKDIHAERARERPDTPYANVLRMLHELILKAFAGSGKALVLAALNDHVTDKERDEIKRFLKEKANG